MGSIVKEMASAPHRKPPRLSVELFRSFVESRPDEERWELIDGVAVMMAPATVAHQRIASNIQRLLHAALERHAPAWTVLQRIGVNLGPAVEAYDPEPDVAVIDSEVSENPGERYVDRFYLAAEVVSASDHEWSETKREIYRLHEACRCVLTVEQDRVEVRVDLRVNDGWSEQALMRLDDMLVLSDFGLQCEVSELYRGTALQPRAGRRG
jgi:Uma2 family endonuclease